MEELGGGAVMGHGSCTADAAVWLCGVEGAVMMAVDQPDAFEELVGVLED